MMIEIVDAADGDDCALCEVQASLYIHTVELSLCRKCARRLSLVIKQELDNR